MVLSKISLRNENNKSSNCEDLEKVLNEIDDSPTAKTPPNMNEVPDFLKESQDNINKTNSSEILLDPLEKLQKEEVEYSKTSENLNEKSIKYVLADDISTFFPVQIDNIAYEILEKISSTFFLQYSTESSLNLSNNSNTNLGLPRCISVP